MKDITVSYSRAEFEGFAPINEEKVLMNLTHFRRSPYDDGQIELRWHIDSGSMKGKYVFDYIHIVPFAATSWKLPFLLESFGKNEDGLLSFKELLGESVVVNLRKSSRSGKDYQNIDYLPKGTSYNAHALGGKVVEKDVVVVDLPF